MLQLCSEQRPCWPTKTETIFCALVLQRSHRGVPHSHAFDRLFCIDVSQRESFQPIRHARLYFAINDVAAIRFDQVEARL